MSTAALPPLPLTKKDFQTDQEVRWCPGCGDYAILSAVQSVFPELASAEKTLSWFRASAAPAVSRIT